MISIILVNYNGYNDTIECIKSINKSRYKDYKVIVVDNNSSDCSVATLNGIKDELNFELIESKINGGFSFGNNIGIKRSLDLGADHILLLNNDTIVESDFLEELIEGFDYIDNCGATIGKIKLESDRDKIWFAGGSFSKRTSKTTHWNYGKKDILEDYNYRVVNFATGCCLCLSSAVVKKIGPMDESFFLYEEDVDYCLRINNAGYKIVYVPNAVLYHKVNASSNQLDSIVLYYMIRNKLFIIKKYFRGLNKVLSYSYTFVHDFYRCIKEKKNLSILIVAISDFAKNIHGKCVHNFLIKKE